MAAAKSKKGGSPPLSASPKKPAREVVRNVGGRPPHLPTSQTRKLVELAKAAGHTDEQIAATLEIGLKTLKAHYAEELEDGGRKISLAIAGNLASIAASSTHPKAVTAAIFWMKARCGWRDTPSDEEVNIEETYTEFTVRIGEKRVG